MRIAKTLSVILSVIALLVLAISCEITPINIEEKINEGSYSSSPIISERDSIISSKSIFAIVDSSESNIDYFKYKFTPYFSNDDGSKVVGSTEGEWVKTFEFPTSWVVYLQQGKWNIQIEMYNASNTKIGDTLNEDVYFSKTNSDLSKTFSSWLVSTGSGKLSFENIVIPKLYQNPKRYEMTAGGSSKEVSNYYISWYLIQNGETKYSGNLEYVSSVGGLSTFGNNTVNNISVGSYTLSLVLYEGLDSSSSIAVGGEVADITVFRNCTTRINATIDTSDYICSYFRASQNETGYTGKIKATYSNGSKTATLELIAENATNVQWYQNGVYKSSYGNGTTANVSNIKSGSASLGIYGTCSNYFDCIFTNSETGLTSSCSYVLVAGGSYGGSSDDSSVLTLETGNEISSWSYTATPIDAIGESFGKGSGSTTKSIYLDERMWTVDAIAYNSNGNELSHGTFVGYINKNDNTIDIPLNNSNGYGWLEIRNIVSSRNYESGSVSNQSISWSITSLETNEVVGSNSSSSFTKVSNYKWEFSPNETYYVKNGSYRVDITTSCKHSGTFLSLGNGTFTGVCSVIVNIHSGVTTIVEGTLTSNYKN